MRITKPITCQVVILSMVLSTHGQGFFQNLNFEQANPVSSGEPLYVTADSALPFWTPTIGGVDQTHVGYNFASTGSTMVSLIGAGGPVAVIDGNYSVLLTGGITASAASISQTGFIPAGTQSLLLEAVQGPGGGSQGNLDVLIANQNVPITLLSTEPNYSLYGANISAWGGKTEELTISASEATTGLNNWTIDDISFSPNAAPEPSTVSLIVVAGLALASRRWSCNGS